MSQITGYVKEIYEGTTKTGRSAGKPFWSITLDTDVKLSTFNAEHMTGVVEGKEYTFTYETDGKYANLSAPSIPVIHTDSETMSPDSTTTPQTDDHTDPKVSPFEKPTKMYPEIRGTASNKDEAIRKAVALKAAVEWAIAVLGGTGTTEDIISYAREFEGYLK